VAQICDETMDVGSQSVFWDGRTDSREVAPSGSYLFVLRGFGFSTTIKLTLLK
jgi:hypothetical protein